MTINEALYLKCKAEDKKAQLATEPDPPAPPTPLEQPLPPPLEQPAPEAVLPDVVPDRSAGLPHTLQYHFWFVSNTRRETRKLGHLGPNMRKQHGA